MLLQNRIKKISTYQLKVIGMFLMDVSKASFVGTAGFWFMGDAILEIKLAALGLGLLSGTGAFLLSLYFTKEVKV